MLVGPKAYDYKDLIITGLEKLEEPPFKEETLEISANTKIFKSVHSRSSTI